MWAVYSHALCNNIRAADSGEISAPVKWKFQLVTFWFVQEKKTCTKDTPILVYSVANPTALNGTYSMQVIRIAVALTLHCSHEQTIHVAIFVVVLVLKVGCQDVARTRASSTEWQVHLLSSQFQPV